MASGLVFEMIRMMAIQDCHSTHFDALYRHSKWWLARASRHVCLVFLFGLTKATGGIWQAAWPNGFSNFQMNFFEIHVCIICVYIYIPLHTYLYFSLPTILGEHVLPNSKGSRIPVSTKGQAAASGAFVQLGGCLCKKTHSSHSFLVLDVESIVVFHPL